MKIINCVNLGNAHEREKDNHIDSGKSMKGPSNRKRIAVVISIVPFLFCEYIGIMSLRSPCHSVWRSLA